MPNAEVLDELLSKFLGDSYSNSDLFDFILGKPTQNQDNLNRDNLDISILDVNTVRRIIAFAKKKYENYELKAAEKTRRSYEKYPGNEMYNKHPYIINKTLDLMKHSMYMTKEKINLTRPFRKKYTNTVGYQIAILYGAAAAILVKMENLYHELKAFYDKTHFLWHLFIYERILSCNVDINDAIEKIFLVQSAYEHGRGPKHPSNTIQPIGNLTREQVKELMRDPSKATAEEKAVLASQMANFGVGK